MTRLGWTCGPTTSYGAYRSSWGPYLLSAHFLRTAFHSTSGPNGLSWQSTRKSGASAWRTWPYGR